MSRAVLRVCPRNALCETIQWERKLLPLWFTLLLPAEMSYTKRAEASSSASSNPAVTSTDEYGIQGCLVRVNVPSYNTGNGQAITRVTALLAVDLARKHLVLTSDLGGEMLFQIHQNRSDVEQAANETRVSKAQCVERLRSFLISKPDIEVCRVEAPFMDKISTTHRPNYD